MNGEKCEGKLEKRLADNIVNIRSYMKNSSDLVLKYAKVCGIDVCVVSFDGQTDANKLANLVYRPLSELDCSGCTPERLAAKISGELLIAGDGKPVTTAGEVVTAAMNGFCVILTDGAETGYAVGVQGFKTRSVTQPENHRNIRGAREGFVEALHTNMSLVRRRVKSNELVMHTMTVGKTSKTEVCVCSMDSVNGRKLADKVIKRLESLPLSLVLESGFIQPFLENKHPMFSEVGASERPDVFVSKLYEGRVGVIIDGSPFALYVPKLFTENFIMLDDYVEKPLFALFIRLIRWLAFFVSILLPGFYAALANFHPELIPDALLRNLAAAESLTPYSVLTECVILDIFYEIMREAGLRLPSNVGHAVSIVGGIVIGDIVVSAGLVGAPMLLAIAIASISGYIVSDIANQVSFMRFALILAGGLFGLFGLTVTSFAFCLGICSAGSWGIPFTSPLAPFSPKSMRDTFVRRSWRKLAHTDPDIYSGTE
ncbi:MAG: spore germination protein [Ruminiclostridium sp.]|nr:spore germination protein [Ruminiclostridium sp.]